jgi:UTP-glucose-1-phosphate uridylyltransferase
MALDTAIIPCGGLGRRLRPITNWVPKEMLPIGLKPALYWALDEAASAGLLRVILVVTAHKPVIEAAARQYQGPLELEFVTQAAFRGLGDAILSARDALAGSPFLLLQPDQLFDGPNLHGGARRLSRITSTGARRDPAPERRAPVRWRARRCTRGRRRPPGGGIDRRPASRRFDAEVAV